MEINERRIAKVRVNARGRRLIGIVAYDALYSRFSEFLNAIDPFLFLKQERSVLAVRKDAVSYLEALEEAGASRRSPAAGEFRRVEIGLHDGQGDLAADLFFPEGATLEDLLADERRFLALRDVVFAKTVERYAWLAVPKTAVVLLKVGDD